MYMPPLEHILDFWKKTPLRALCFRGLVQSNTKLVYPWLGRLRWWSNIILNLIMWWYLYLNHSLRALNLSLVLFLYPNKRFRTIYLPCVSTRFQVNFASSQFTLNSGWSLQLIPWRYIKFLFVFLFRIPWF